MEFLKKSKKVLLGSLAGTFISFTGPISPIGMTEHVYTLEELSFQSTANLVENENGQWSFQWVYPKGFVLQRMENHTGATEVPLRQAVHRSVIGEIDITHF